MSGMTPTPQGIALFATYHFLVETDGSRGSKRRYDGPDAADAMAAWSKAISQGQEYVTLEALRDRPIAPAKPSSLLAAKDGGRQ